MAYIDSVIRIAYQARPTLKQLSQICLLSLAYINMAYSQPYAFHIDTDKITKSPIAQKNFTLTPADAIRSRNGHFYTLGKDLVENTGDDVRVRFWGINITPSMTFPISEQDAERLAQRLENLGFNLARINAIDFIPRKPYLSIFLNTNQPYPDINKKNYAALKMLVAAFKKHGIYVDLVLKYGYKFDPKKDCIVSGNVKTCVPDPMVTTQHYPVPGVMPEGSAPLDIFTSTMQSLEMEYFKEILKMFRGEPTLALIEISNEASLIETYTKTASVFPPLYAETLDNLWNNWLHERYGTTDKIISALPASQNKSEGIQLLANGSFTQTSNGSPLHWNLSQWELDGIKHWGDWSVSKTGLNIQIEKIPVKPWYFFLSQPNIHIHKDDKYQLSFKAKANPARDIRIELKREYDGKSASISGRARTFKLTDELKDYSFCFQANVSTNSARLIIMPITPGSSTGSILVDHISFMHAPSALTLPRNTKENELISDRKISRPDNTQSDDCLIDRSEKRDYLLFLADLEKKYYSNIRSYIHDLGFSIPVTGTQANYGGLLSQKNMSDNMDYLDVHYYWDHPHISSKPPGRWWMKNTPMVDDPYNSVVSIISSNHNTGLPLTISEYSHNLASDYSQEGLIIAAAYGSLQDIDGIFLHNYNSSGSSIDARKHMQPIQLTSWYNILGDTRSEALMHAASTIFRKGLVSPARSKVIIPISDDVRISSILNNFPIRNIQKIINSKPFFDNNPDLPVNPLMNLIHGVEIQHDGKLKITGISELPARLPETITSDTGELSWKTGRRAYKNSITVNTSMVKAITGYLNGKFTLDNISVQGVGEENQFGTLTILSNDSLVLTRSKDIILTTVGAGKNIGTELVKSGKGVQRCVSNTLHSCKHNFFHRNAGEVYVEQNPVKIVFKTDAKSISIQELNTIGMEMGQVKTKVIKGGFEFIIGQSRTPWYQMSLQY